MNSNPHDTREDIAEFRRHVGAPYDVDRDVNGFTMRSLGVRASASVAVLDGYRAKDPRVKILQFSRNFGHQIAITAGLDYATGDATVVMDSDLQDPPEVIPNMWAKWKEGYEVVYAVRAEREGETWFKKTTAALFYRIIFRITDVKIPLDTGDFCLLDRKVVNVMNQMREKHRFLRGMSSWIGFKQVGVSYKRAARLS